MADYALIIAHTMQDAISSAVAEWRWEQTGSPDFRLEFRRPDTGERVRYVGDHHGGLRGLRWRTKVYLADGHRKRRDWGEIRVLLDMGMFEEGDPVLPSPRHRKSKDVVAEAVRAALRNIGDL